MDVRVILQCRLASLRLPAKALLPLGDLPAVVLCAKRAATTNRNVTVAISDLPSDDLLAKVLSQHNIPFARGSSDDVIARFLLVCGGLPDSTLIVRLTADNPFPDGNFIETLLDVFESQNLDYLTTTFPISPLPYGMSAEVFKVGDLKHAHQHAASTFDKEHVTPWIAQHVQKKLYFAPPGIPQNVGHLRCTLDTFEDYQRLAQIFQNVYSPISATWQELTAHLAALPTAPTACFPKKIVNGLCNGEFTLGTVQLGMPYGRANKTGMPDAGEAANIIREGVAMGITCFDTARAYGIAERRLGDALGGGLKEQVSIVTKLDAMNWLGEDTPVKTVEAAVDASVYHSCVNLKTHSIQTLLLHRWHHFHLAKGSLWKRLLSLRSVGVIGRLGASVSTPQEGIAALNSPDITHLQIPFNLLDWRWLDAEFQQAVVRRPDVTIHARSPLLQGLLANSEGNWPALPGVDKSRLMAVVDGLVEKHGRSCRADLCYAYVRSFTWISSIVVGVETRQQLHHNLQLFQNSPLTELQVKEMQKIFAAIPVTLLDPAGWGQ